VTAERKQWILTSRKGRKRGARKEKGAFSLKRDPLPLHGPRLEGGDRHIHQKKEEFREINESLAKKEKRALLDFAEKKRGSVTSHYSGEGGKENHLTIKNRKGR